MQITDVSLLTDGVALNGEWEFYWHELLLPKGFTESEGPHQLVKVPADWRSYNKENPLPSFGYATYRLKLTLPESVVQQKTQLAVYTMYQYSAYRIYWNGELVAAGGVVDSDPGKAKPDSSPVTASLPLVNTQNVEVIVQVANYYRYEAGFVRPIKIGFADEMIVSDRNRKLSEASMLGALLLLGLFFLMTYFTRPIDKAILWFAICCLMAFVRTFCAGERLIMIAFPEFPYDLMRRINNLSTILAVIALLLYIDALIENKFALRIRAGLLLLLGVNTIPYLFLSSYWYTRLFTLNTIVLPAALFYTVVISLIGLKQKKPGSVLIATGFLIIFLLAINDFIYSLWVIGPGYLISVGVVMLIATHSSSIFLRFARTYQQTELAKKQLTNEVRLRTRHLQEALAETEQAKAAKNAFFAMMTHELRTPLNGIVGIANLFDHQNLDEEQRVQLEVLRASSSHLMTVINDILDFSAIEADSLELHPDRVFLSDLMNEVGALAYVLSKKSPIDFQFRYRPSHLSYWVWIDAVRFRQALYNLLSNAFKFTETGSVIFRCTRISKTDDTIRLRFSVRDSGVGITEDDRSKLFQAYQQIDSSPTRRHGGTGLGLFITAHIISALNSRLHLRSIVGKGSIFYFTVSLPLTEKPALSADAVIVEDLAKDYPMQILVVEDDLTNQIIIERFCHRLGYTVDMAGDGHDAIYKVSQKKYDLILMDLHMPGVSGAEATKKIRELENGLTLPIVAITADSSIESQKECKEAGMNGLLMKPFSLASLSQLIQSVHVKANQ